MAIGDALLGGYQPMVDQGTQYDVWLRNQFGGSPLAYGYGQQMAPWQQLQYMSSPISGDVDLYGGTANPFTSWLNQDQTPLSSAQWQTRAADITGALNAPATGNVGGGTFDAGQELIRQRFGAANENAEARQRALAFAPIMAETSRALRGEIGNVLSNIYQNYQMSPYYSGAVPAQDIQGTPVSFLNWAQQRGGGAPGLWEQFQLPAAVPTA